MPRFSEVAGKAMGKMKETKQVLTGGEGIFARLANEHGQVNAMLQRCAMSSAGSEARAELFPKIRRELMSHAKAEETEVYSVFRTIPELADKISHAKGEHSRIEMLLNQLASMSYSDENWGSVCRDLMKEVEHHVIEEEQRVFPEAKKALSKEQSEAIEAAFDRTKQQLMTSLS